MSFTINTLEKQIKQISKLYKGFKTKKNILTLNEDILNKDHDNIMLIFKELTNNKSEYKNISYSNLYNNIKTKLDNDGFGGSNSDSFSLPTVNIDNSSENINNISDYNMIINTSGSNNYNISVKQIFKKVYNNTTENIQNIENIENITNDNSVKYFIDNSRILVDFGDNIYNLKLNLFLLFIFRYTNIDIDIDIDSYNISINNNNTINNISITNLFQYFIKKFDNLKEVEPPSTNNIDIYYYNNQVIFDTKKNVSFESVVLTSDIRFKENIIPLNNSLNKLNKLKPKEFYYKNNKNKKCIGFIAQDILETELEYIVEQKDKEHYKVDYNNVIGLLTGSVQELSQELKCLKQEMKDIKEQNKLLKELLFKSSNK